MTERQPNPPHCGHLFRFYVGGRCPWCKPLPEIGPRLPCGRFESLRCAESAALGLCGAGWTPGAAPLLIAGVVRPRDCWVHAEIERRMRPTPP